MWSRWFAICVQQLGFDTKTRLPFSGDGSPTALSLDGHCGMVAEEATSLDLVDVCAASRSGRCFGSRSSTWSATSSAWNGR